MDRKGNPSIHEMERVLGDDPAAIEIRPDGEVRYIDQQDRPARPLVLRTRGIGDNY